MTDFSRSGNFFKTNDGPPVVTPHMVKSVSQYRRGTLEDEVSRGDFQEPGSRNKISEKFAATPAGNVVSSKKMVKTAEGGSTSLSQGNSNWRGQSGNTVRQIPEIYSPLWLNSNLNLPRDRATINAWSRSFFALNPIVQNAISLHSTYPISKLSIKCKHEKVEKFFSNMIEEIDLMNICCQIAQEYWILGEAFVYAELDERSAKWSRLLIQNPDYIVVKHSVIAGEPIISLRPDENLRRIVTSNRPADVQQRQRLDKSIIEHVKRGENIPLSNFYVSHLARRISPYETRGTGLTVSSFRQLMLFDQLRECFDDQTEVLTEQGFKKFSEVIDYQDLSREEVISNPKQGIKVACFNPETEQLEYHVPTDSIVKNYTGEMVNFKLRNLSLQVTPNHEVWVQKKNRLKGIPGWTPWTKTLAKDVSPTTTYHMRSVINWTGQDPETVSILDKNIPTELYLKFLGYLLSEGCVSQSQQGTSKMITITQKVTSDCHKDIEDTITQFAQYFDKKVYHNLRDVKQGNFQKKPDDVDNFIINSSALHDFFKKEISDDQKCTSEYKRIPRYVFDYSPRLLGLILETLTLGDGSHLKNKKSKAFKFYTSSVKLANDVQELALKCGYSSNIFSRQRQHKPEYIVSWSEASDGRFPVLMPNNKRPPHIFTSQYDGKVYCLTVPTGLMLVRHHGKISVQANCKFAQAQNMINPLTLVKIGGADYKPSQVDLEAWREVFECHDEETEVLTSKGFKKYSEVMDYDASDTNTVVTAAPKQGTEIACFNPETEALEYHQPQGASLYNYNGKMYHISNQKLDIKVTPNHDLWVAKRKNVKNTSHAWDKWEKIKAQDVNYNDYYRTRSCLTWQGQEQQYVEVCGKQVPIELYLQFLGYLVSEGSVYKTQGRYCVSYCQSVSKHYLKMKQCFEDFAAVFEKPCHHNVRKDFWTGTLCSKELFQYFKNNIGDNQGDTHSEHKRVPDFVLNLPTRLLNIFLEAIMDGDGHVSHSRIKGFTHYSYTTISLKLADQIQEMALKCGYSPLLENYKNKSAYKVNWSVDKVKGSYPIIHQGKGSHDAQSVTLERYTGKVWCFQVPTGLFVTRRKGKITIQGNSAQYDKDFKIFTHEAVTVERVGHNSAILDINPDITQLIKEIYIGLMVPQVVMDGGGDITYQNGGVSLDVLRQRYMQFRNMLSSWLRRKVFAPISKINEFYEYKDGEKVLIVPDIDWNHMSIFDGGDFITNLTQLTAEPKRVSVQTLYRSLGLDWEDEKRKMKEEAVHDAILNKEKETLGRMSLNDLRSIGPDDEIQEIIESPVPGESPYEQSTGGGSGGPPPPPGLEGLPGLGGGPSGPPPGPPPGAQPGPGPGAPPGP